MACGVVVFESFGVRFHVSGAAGKDASLVRLLRQARDPQWSTIGEPDLEHHHHNSPAEATAEERPIDERAGCTFGSVLADR